MKELLQQNKYYKPLLSITTFYTHLYKIYVILNVFYYRYQRTHQESLSSGDCYIPAYLKIETTRIIGVKELLQQDQGLP